MPDAETLLAALVARGVRVSIDGEDLQLSPPAAVAALPTGMAEMLQEFRPEVIDLLRFGPLTWPEPADRCAGCRSAEAHGLRVTACGVCHWPPLALSGIPLYP